MEDRRALFDDWAEHYDASVDDESGFPFTGYRNVPATALIAVDPAPGQTVLNVGCGTGNLSLLFTLAGCAVTSADFSPTLVARDKGSETSRQTRDDTRCVRCFRRPGT